MHFLTHPSGPIAIAEWPLKSSDLAFPPACFPTTGRFPVSCLVPPLTYIYYFSHVRSGAIQLWNPMEIRVPRSHRRRADWISLSGRSDSLICPSVSSCFLKGYCSWFSLAQGFILGTRGMSLRSLIVKSCRSFLVKMSRTCSTFSV